jgi:hypothetical protein
MDTIIDYDLWDLKKDGDKYILYVNIVDNKGLYYCSKVDKFKKVHIKKNGEYIKMDRVCIFKCGNKYLQLFDIDKVNKYCKTHNSLHDDVCELCIKSTS